MIAVQAPAVPGLPGSVLIANRGEIALRIARTARRLGLQVLGVFSSADAGQPHLRLCHKARELHGDPRQVYLDAGLLLDAARALGAEALHPGYGFLAENRAFAAAVEEAGIRFVGPTAEQIGRLGDKLEARKAARKIGLPTVPGSLEPIADPVAAELLAAQIGAPVIIKAAGGGGGRGMRVVENLAELRPLLERAQSEAKASFGDDRVFLEKYFPAVRHIEIQILGDGRGQAVSLGERDCSVQRRHQKLIEESPTPGLPPEVTEEMGRLAAGLAASAGYRGAGTLEFLVPTGTRDFFFIEMNTRLQVEHPVTEMRTGLDLVEEQLRIAGGLGLSFDPRQLRQQGAAIEARIIAEDPEAGFRPCQGRLETVLLPAGPGIRVDAWAEQGLEVSPYYDSLLAKVLAWGRNREEAIQRLTGALGETFIAPLQTTAGFLGRLVNEAPFRSGNYDTSLLRGAKEGGGASRQSQPPGPGLPLPLAVLAAAARLDSAQRVSAPELGYRGRALSSWQQGG